MMLPLIVGLAALPVSWPTPATQLHRYHSSALHMGTQFTVILYATDKESANRGFKAAFRRIGQLDSRLSDYRTDSELNRLCRSAPDEVSAAPRPFGVSGDLWQVLQTAQRLSRRTNGAFDVTVGPLTRLWRRARRQRELPSDERLRQALSAVGYQYLHLDEGHRTVTLLRPNMRLDLGGIAKGYATDEALKALKELGIDRALVNAGGDIGTGAAPPDSRGWKVAVAPLDPREKPSRFLLVENRAVATSGDAWQYVEMGGKRYSHIVDPRTGLGLTRRSSVSVVAGDGISADSLASAVSVLGPENGLALIEDTPGADAFVVQVVNGEILTTQSQGFPDLPTAD